MAKSSRLVDGLRQELNAREFRARSMRRELSTLFFTGEPVRNYRDAKRSTQNYARFFREMLDRGIFLAPSQFEAAFVSATHTSEDIEDNCCGSGFVEGHCSGTDNLILKGESNNARGY